MSVRKLMLSIFGVAVIMLQASVEAGHYKFEDLKFSSSSTESYGIKFFKGEVAGVPPVMTYTFVTTDYYSNPVWNEMYYMCFYNMNFTYAPAGGVQLAGTRVEIWDLNNDIKISETNATWVP